MMQFGANRRKRNNRGLPVYPSGALILFMPLRGAGWHGTPIQPALSGYAAKLRHPSPIKGEESASPFPLDGGRIQRLGPLGPSRSWMGVKPAMKKTLPPMAITRARALRRAPTDAEQAMWALLRAQFADARFRRQVPLGFAIADFASHRARLVIEIDGGQHGGAADAARTAMIEREGYRVVRFWNNEVLANKDGVARILASVLKAGAASPPSSLR